MPTPSDTLHAIKGAAEVNSAAFASIKAEIPGWLTAIEAWTPTITKGLLRDELARLQAAYAEAQKQAARVIALTAQGIAQLGTGGDPSILPPSVPWSTGELQIAFGVHLRPPAAAELGRYLVVENVTWDALLSRAKADAAPTAQADVVFSVAGTPIVRFRWAPGSLVAVVTVLVAASVPGDVIIVSAPAIQDLTFAGIAGTLVGRRLGT